MDIIKYISSIVGAVLQIIALATMFVKPIRNKFTNWLLSITKSKELQESVNGFKVDLQQVKEIIDTFEDRFFTEELASKAAIRTEILRIYYKYLPNREMPVYARQNLSILKDIYLNHLHGNSFVSDVCKEMDEWPTLTDDIYFKKYSERRYE